MDHGSILREIDAELDRLMKVRNILAELAVPPAAEDQVQSTRSVARRRRAAPVEIVPKPALLVPEPQLVVLPPKQKREYRRRVKVHVPAPRALAAPLSDKPVVVHRPASTVKVAIAPVPTQRSSEEIEATMRQKLLGGAA